MPAKLLGNRPTAEVQVGHRHTRLVVISAFAVLLLGTVVGILLIRPGPSSEPERPAVELSTWVDEASRTCQRISIDHPILTEGNDARTSPGNLDAVRAGVNDLVTSVGAIPMPSRAADAADVEEALQVGDLANQTWHEAAEGTSTTAGATELTGVFIAALTELGADCAHLG